MLPPASRSIVRRDSVLPGLGAVLDDERFAETLSAVRPDLGIAGSLLTYVRYKPGVSCLVTHRLATDRGPVEVYAKTFAAVNGDKVAKAKLDESEGRTVVLEGGSTVVRSFPADAKLPRLAQLARPERVRHLVARATSKAAARGAPTDLAHETRLQRLAYKPERRFVARLGEDAAVLKFSRPTAFRRAYAAARALVSGESLIIPKWIGRSRRHGLIMFEWLEGRSVREEIGLGDWQSTLRAVGRALAELHRQNPAGLPSSDRRAEITRLQTLARQFGFVLPALTERAQRLAGELGSYLVSLPPSRVAIHGDFYDKQLLAAAGRTVFLDIDQARVGDPGDDVGNFVAHLELRSLGEGWRSGAVRDMAAALIDGYTSCGELLEPRWRAHVAAGLLRLVHQPFRYGLADWPAISTAILDRAEAWIATATPTTRVSMARPRVLCLNQDAGVGPGRSKGAAVHLGAMRAAFAELGGEVVAVDEPDPALALERLAAEQRKAPIDLVYERYALGRATGAEFALTAGIPHVVEVNAPLATEAAQWRGLDESDTDRRGDERLFTHASLVLAVSKPVADYSVERGAPRERVQVMPNGVDVRRFQPRAEGDPLRERLVPADRFVLGFHGRLRPWHGFGLLVEAFERLLQEGAPVHLLVVGEGAFDEELDGRIPPERRTLVGWQAHDAIGRYVAAFDALPLTYPADQPFYFSPLKLAEAMACEVVPVVPDLEGLPDQVRNGREGLVYPAGDARALVAGLRGLIDSPRLRKRLAMAARLRALDMSWTRAARVALEATR